jgi:gliding motility-associated-like protein
MNYHLQIFDRWGVEIFESKQEYFLWDGYNAAGIQVPEGTYYYVFTGIDFKEHPFSQKGFVTLIRQ